MGNKREILHKAAAALLTMTMLASCAQVKNIAYFQDKAIDHPEEIDKHGGIVIQPKDMISIVVSSRNPELATMFNLPVVSYQAGSEIVTSASIFRWSAIRPALKSSRAPHSRSSWDMSSTMTAT